MKEILLTKGKVAYIDDEDYALVSQYSWAYFQPKSGPAYAVSQISVGQGKQKAIRMHRIIMNAKPNELIDHRDGDGLNNQKYNLRLCTQSQNRGNSRHNKFSKAPYKGLSWRKDNRVWQVTIGHNSKHFTLGTYKSPEKAFKVYCNANLLLHGEFANDGLYTKPYIVKVIPVNNESELDMEISRLLYCTNNKRAINYIKEYTHNQLILNGKIEIYSF
jgi:hypothetical protein